ncbi:thiamine ABC transporter permease [Clostridia bacterium]|nr:thiamine ABC transporter permease [Clostridia bacterium]
MSKSKGKNSELFKRFYPYFHPYRKDLLIDLGCAAGTIVCEIALPFIIRALTSAGMENSMTLELVVRLGLLYAVLRMVEICAAYYMNGQGHIMGAKMERDMRTAAFSHLTKLSENYYHNNKVGQIMSKITTDLFEVTEFAHHCPEEFFIAALKSVIAFILLLRINLWLTVIIFLLLPFMATAVSYCTRFVRAAFRKQGEFIGELNAKLEDTLLGEKVMKAFTNEELEKEKFEQGNVEFLSIKRFTYRYLAALQVVNRLFEALMYLVVILVGGTFVYLGYLKAADLVAYVLFISTLLGTIRRIAEFTEQFQKGMSGIERFFQILDAPIEIFDEEGAKTLDKIQGSIAFEQVSFSYEGSSQKVLENLSFSVKAGEKIALVGSSGAGKTTICHLIPRFYDPTQGKILIDGQDILSIRLSSLRKHIGIVQQDVYLFAGTVYENILYGNPSASREEVEEAAKLAGAHTFILGLSEGYDSYVGERGVKLSGGQKQRISIARVFLKNPPILILDEATSALDNESEYIVSQSLERLAKGRTSITIAHRLTTIQDADRILVLSENGIEEEGTHDELMRKQGMYYQFQHRA